jgi:dTDP-4-dehydrorhamnose 3,5-epimerase
MTSPKLIHIPLPGVIVIEPAVYADDRGFFFESFNQRDFNDLTETKIIFVQDNHSKSSQAVLRGLHYQIQQAQGKLVRVVEGSIFDVAVDIREGSPTFGKWFGIELTAENKKQVWVPPDFAHGFLVLSEVAQVLYKSTDYYAPEHERSIKWDDPDLAINWPELPMAPLLSTKDKKACSLRDADLPKFLP